MKNGIAASGNLLIALNISLTEMQHVRCDLDARRWRQADRHRDRDAEREAQQHRQETSSTAMG
jgi:hypothetical protein